MCLTSFKNANEGVRSEEKLHQLGEPSILIWHSLERSLVVPKSWSRKNEFMACYLESEKNGWPLVLRSSGGGTVPQGPEVINIAIIAPVKSEISYSICYQEICTVISSTLSKFGITTGVGSVEGSFCDGDWNVTVGGRKIAGTAQRWRLNNGTKVALIHAAILTKELPESFWSSLGVVEHSAGSPLQARKNSHVVLSDLLPDTIQVSSILDELEKSAKESLIRISIETQSETHMSLCKKYTSGGNSEHSISQI